MLHRLVEPSCDANHIFTSSLIWTIDKICETRFEKCHTNKNRICPDQSCPGIWHIGERKQLETVSIRRPMDSRLATRTSPRKPFLTMSKNTFIRSVCPHSPGLSAHIWVAGKIQNGAGICVNLQSLSALSCQRRKPRQNLESHGWPTWPGPQAGWHLREIIM